MLWMSILASALTPSLYRRGWFYRPIPFPTLRSTLRQWGAEETHPIYCDMPGWQLTCTHRHASVALYDGHDIKAVAQYREERVGHYLLRGLAAQPGDYAGVVVILESCVAQNITLDWDALRVNAPVYVEMSYHYRG